MSKISSVVLPGNTSLENKREKALESFSQKATESPPTIEKAIYDILSHIGEDPNREGLARTPYRVHKMYQELLSGYHIDPVSLVNNAYFQVDGCKEMVVVKGIEYFSMCEHHMLPFYGRVHIAYMPRNRVIGLSKIPRIVEMFARRLQIQERMTRQIAEMIDEVLNPQGVAVVADGMHMCMVMRGVKKNHARMVTSSILGIFENEPLFFTFW
ncbi:GTP cyclohydrolase I FolE [Chloroflexi bacterium TSY]|nr:GTP cyclohydrolase I FolE [Chloroflexi bacterium TSY]